MKVVVIGLDGATWNLLEPWAKEGTLPTIRQLMEKGVWGKLESTIPPSTFPAWKCYSTGKNPGKLGVFHFTSLDMKQKKLTVHNARDFKAKDIWDYLGEANFQCGVINMPGTYPVKRINGFMIAGYPAESHDYTYPPSLEIELKRNNYVLHPKSANKHSFSKNKSAVKNLFSSRFAIARKYLKDLDFIHLTIRYTDTVQHLLWNSPHILREYWAHLDGELENLLESDSLGEDAYIFLMSDHGFTKLKNSFFLNNWLHKNGYLVVKQGKKTSILKLIPSPKTILRTVGKLHLEWVLSVTPESIKSKAVQRLSLFPRIDWDRTRAVASGNIGIEKLYINKEGLQADQVYMLTKKLKKQLKDIKDPLTGQNVMKVFEKEEIYKGPYVYKAPDLMIVPESGYQIVGSFSNSGNIWGKCPNKREAFHEQHGIFLAYGPSIRKGEKTEDAKIYDLAPTILHIFGLSIPKDIDGRILSEIFEPNSEPGRRPVVYEPAGEKDRVKGKITKLRDSGVI